MIEYIIPLIACMKPMWFYVLNHLIALFFIATVPVILREIIGLRGKKINV